MYATSISRVQHCILYFCSHKMSFCLGDHDKGKSCCRRVVTHQSTLIWTDLLCFLRHSFTLRLRFSNYTELMFTEAKTHMHDFYIQHTVKKREEKCVTALRLTCVSFHSELVIMKTKRKKNNCHQGLLS